MRRFILLSFLFLGCRSNPVETAPPFDFNDWTYYLQDIVLDSIISGGFDVVVMDYSADGSEEGEFTLEQINRIRDVGTIPIAYISIGEAEDYRFYWDSTWYSSPPGWLGNENPHWQGNYAVKYWMDGWKSIVFSYLDRVLEQGFAGVYLDKVDEFEYWSDLQNNEDTLLSEEDAARLMIQFVREISDYLKERAGEDFLIILQNGENILQYDDGSLLERISGWAVEDLFYDGTSPTDSEWISERTAYLDMVLEAGKFVLVVDYVDDGSGHSGENMERIRDFTDRAMSFGYVPYAAYSDRELDRIDVIEGIQPR